MPLRTRKSVVTVVDGKSYNSSLMKPYLMSALVLVFGLMSQPVFSADPVVPPAVSTATDTALRDMDMIAAADALYAKRTETAGAAEALVMYEKAAAAITTSAVPLWKSARACHWIADHATVRAEKIATFEKGIAYAERAIDMDPKSVEAHFWLGALWGSYGESRGVLKSLSLVGPIRREMDTVVRLNDRYQGGAGYRVLGIVDYKVPGFAGGSKRRAAEQLNKSLVIDPENAFNRFYMAEYCVTVGDKAKAIENLDALANLEPTDDVDAAELKSIQAKGTALRAKIK